MHTSCRSRGAALLLDTTTSAPSLIIRFRHLPLGKLAELDESRPIICFNLKLDTLRGDLGLPGFPSKATHHEFLSKVKPVYYMCVSALLWWRSPHVLAARMGQ
eukprot:scaffold312498_cov33-Tisochrysis_lutea.AAC.2